MFPAVVLGQIEEKHRAELRDILDQNGRGKGRLILAIDSFAKAELAMRTYKLAPEKGVALIRRIVLEKLPMRQVQEELADVANRSPLKASRFRSLSEAGREYERQMAVLEENAHLLYGDSPARFYHNRYRFRLVNIDAVALAWEDLSVSYVDGFTILPPVPPKAAVHALEVLSRADYAASFFRRLWLYAPNPAGWPLDQLAQGLDQLDLPTVGIVAFDEAGDLKVVRKPRSADKPPRYRTVLEEVMRQGIPDFAAE